MADAVTDSVRVTVPLPASLLSSLSSTGDGTLGAAGGGDTRCDESYTVNEIKQCSV